MSLRLACFAVLLMIFACAGLPVSDARARSQPAATHAPHPAMAAFLMDLKSGDLEKAAGRISKIGDFDGEHFFAFQPTRDQFVAFLANCKLISGTYGPGDPTTGPLQSTEWNCPAGKSYTVKFWPEDAFFFRTTVFRPYLMVGAIETAEFRTAREAVRSVVPVGALLPTIRVFSEQELRDERQKEELERLAAFGYRDTIGKAVLRGELVAIAQFATAETKVSYSTRDQYFGVRLENARAMGAVQPQALLQKAISELGNPTTVSCNQPETRWAPHVCRWTLSNPENGLYVEMYFRGPGGLLSSFNIFRETPAEAAVLRQRALEAGLING